MKNSLAEIIQKYDAFILDIWGVIHDGQKTYPGVLETIKELNRLGKKIIFLSNAPRRASRVKTTLKKFGIAEDMYLDAVSSGEVTYKILSNSANQQPSNYYYIGPEKDRDLLKGLNYAETKDASKAAFAVTTGFDEDDSTLDEKLPQITECLAVGLKLYCANPDMLVVRQNGSRMLCAGVIAKYYEEQGGKVVWIGKPHVDVYEECLAKLGVARQKIVAIGDNLDTDILGANNFGIDSALALSGVLKFEKRDVQEIINETGIKPTYIIKSFRI